MATTTDLLRSVRNASSELTSDAIAQVLVDVGWPEASLDRPVGRPGVVVARLGGQPQMLVATEASAPGTVLGVASARSMSLGYSSEAPYTLVWTPEVVQLHQTTFWSLRPGDVPLLEVTNADTAATANTLEMLSPDSIVSDEPLTYQRAEGRQQPGLAERLGQALGSLRRSVVAANPSEGVGAHDLEVMRLFHQLLFIRFIEDRHPTDSVERIEMVLNATDPREQLAQILRHYSETLKSELFTRPSFPVDSIHPHALKNTIEALTKPWSDLHLDFRLTPNDVSGRLYESYLGQTPSIQEEEGTLFPLVGATDDRSQRASFYTPTAVATELAKATLLPWLEVHQPTHPSEVRVLDPACGSGAFLLAAYRVLREHFERARGHGLDHNERRELLADSIFGVDLDESALMLAQVALYEEADLGSDSSLPAMGRNLLHGDSLLSPPGGPSRGGIAWGQVVGSGGQFQVVLANPPFGAQKTRASRSTSEYRQQLRSAYSATHDWGADLAYYFVELAFLLLDQDGTAGFVLPRKSISGTTAARLRRLMAARGVRTIQDYRGARLFPSVSSYVSLVTLGAPETSTVQVSDVRDSRTDPALLLDGETRSANVRSVTVGTEVLSCAPSWSAFELRWHGLRDQIGARWSELGEQPDITVTSGIQTGANSRFVVEPDKVAQGFVHVAGRRVPERLCPRFVKGPDVLPFRLIADAERRVVLPFKPGTDEARVLDQLIAALGGRPAHTQLGRTEVWLAPKVLVRAFGFEPAAAIDLSGTVVAPKGTAGAFAVASVPATRERLTGIMAYFNSAFAQWWLRGVGEPRYDETVEILEGQLRRLPWPIINDEAWSSLAQAAEAVLLTLSLEDPVQRTAEWWAARRRVDDLVLDLLQVGPDLRQIVFDEVFRRA